MQQSIDELPLLELFTRLRQAGLPLGMDEYKLLLQALQRGFGLPDEAAIARLCKTLWVKSEDDQLLFNYHFEAVMTAEREKLAAQRAEAELAAASPDLTSLQARKNNWIIRFRKMAIVAGGMTIATFAAFSWLSRPKCPYFVSRPPGWLGLGGLIDPDEEYRYEIKTCQGNPTSIPQIEVLLKPPQLSFQSNQDGTALLSGNFGSEDSQYVRVDHWAISDDSLAYFPFSQPLSSVGYYANTDSLQFSPDGQVLIVTSLTGDVQVWAMQADRELVDKDQINKELADSEQANKELADGQTGDRIIANLEDVGIVEDVQFSADGQFFALLTESGSARLYTLAGELLTAFNGQGDVRSIVLSPIEDKLAVRLGGDGRTQLWDFEGNLLFDFNNQGIQEIAFSPDGQHLAMLSNQGQGQLFDVVGQSITSFEVSNTEAANIEAANDAQAEGIREIKFSPDNQHVAVVLNAGDVQIWDVTGNLLRSLVSEGTNEVHFSSDGKRLLTRSFSDTANLWTLEGDGIADFNKQDNIRAVAFSGNNVVLNLSDDSAQLWNDAGVQQDDFDLYYSIFDFVLGPKGRYMVSRASDGTATLWDLVEQRSIVSSAQSIKGLNTVVFSPDGQSFITLSSTREVKLQVTGETKGKDGITQTEVQSFKLMSSNNIEEFSNRATNFGAIVFLVYISLPLLLPTGYFILRKLTHARLKPTEFPPVEDLPSDVPTAVSALNQNLEDELQVAQAIQQGTPEGMALPLQAFTESSEYFPITRRQMKQSWRHLRRLVREGPAIELDIESTIAQVSREGMLLQPALRSRRVNRNQLLLLIDQDGSMVPFHALSDRLVQTAIHGGRLARAGTYYFHNCPTDYLYDDRYHQSAHPINTVLSDFHSGYASVLIFSDAGAARGAFNQQRLDLTLQFLDQLQSHLSRVVWLNPMPRDRWVGTAHEIAKRIPMFELTRPGLNQSIDVLRGKPFHF